MADKEIYVKQKFGAGATLENLQLKNNLPTAGAGKIAYDGKFKISESSSWVEVTTENNTQTLDNKTISGGEFS